MRDVTRPEVILERMGKISIHTSREGCDIGWMQIQIVNQISIHASCEGCDQLGRKTASSRILFQSTHPVRDATINIPKNYTGSPISIHASREGCDAAGTANALAAALFQSTHPVRDATGRLELHAG